MKTISLALVCLFAFASGAEAAYQKVAENKLFNGETLTEYKLDNGMRVILIPRHQAKVLAYQVWFDVGSIDEILDPKLKKTGLAHLFEHMMFRGSEKYPDGKFDEITSRLGTDRQNASTYYYRTNYYQNVPSKYLEPIMELEADRMQNLKLNSDLLEKEKGAVVGEYRRYLDNPGALANEELMKLVYTEAPFKNSVIGTEDWIRGFTMEEGNYFYRTFYAPNNATLIVIGDTTEKELMGLVEKYYGGMKSQTIPKIPAPEEPVQKVERKKEITHGQATSEMLLVAYRAPKENTREAVSLSLLGTHLSVGMESRLRKRLVDTGIAVRAVGYYGGSPDIFEFVVSLTDKHKAEEALRIIDSEVARLVKQPLSKEEFLRSLNQEKLSLYSEISDNASLASFLGEYLSRTGSYMRGFEVLAAFNTLTREELHKVCKDVFKRQQRSVLILRPAGKGKS